MRVSAELLDDMPSHCCCGFIDLVYVAKDLCVARDAVLGVNVVWSAPHVR